MDDTFRRCHTIPDGPAVISPIRHRRHHNSVSASPRRPGQPWVGPADVPRNNFPNNVSLLSTNALLGQSLDSTSTMLSSMAEAEQTNNLSQSLNTSISSLNSRSNFSTAKPAYMYMHNALAPNYPRIAPNTHDDGRSAPIDIPHPTRSSGLRPDKVDFGNNDHSFGMDAGLDHQQPRTCTGCYGQQCVLCTPDYTGTTPQEVINNVDGVMGETSLPDLSLETGNFDASFFTRPRQTMLGYMEEDLEGAGYDTTYD